MKIERIETHVCHARMRNWVFVKVVTDQPGLHGWGEATLEWHTRSVVGAVEDIAELLVGEDPRRIEHLWQMMFRQHFWHGNGIVRGTAISGIDLALWDILGKIHGVPVHQLWGGPVRDHIRLYCHLGGGRMEDFYETDCSDAKRFGDLAREAVEDGFSAFKSMAVPPTMPLEGTRPIRYAAECVEAMREAVGPDIDIMVDCHARPSPRMGLLFAKALEPYDLYFFEEPCWPESIDDIARIQEAVKTPIATGERLVTQHAFREVLEKRACSVLQPDITHCGGLSEARRIAAMAEAYRVALAPHNPQGPVSTAASIELGFATPSYVICESVHNDVPWRDDVVQEGFQVDPATRTVRPNTLPGLGVELNEDEIAKHPFQQEQPQRVFYSDGAVGDLVKTIMATEHSLAGVLPVLQLPFQADESIDWDTLSREIDWAYENGAHGLVAAMVTEVLRLTDAERDELAQRLVEFNAGRGPVVMSVGDESTVQAVRHVRIATAAGVDALMAIPPAASRALLAEKIRYYEAIIAATHLPVIVQDASGYVGEPLPVEAQADLYQRFGERVLFKPEAQPLGPNLSRLRDAGGPGLKVFEGSGGIALLDSYRRGICGTMPGTEIVWAIRAEWDALEAGDLQRATELQGIIAPLIFLQQGLDGFLSVEKALLHRQGVFPNRIVRGPVGFTLDPETEHEAFRLFDLLCESCGKELSS